MNSIGRKAAVLGSSAAIGVGAYFAPKLHEESYESARTPQAHVSHVTEANQVARLTDSERAVVVAFFALAVAGVGLALTSEEAMQDPRTRGYS